MAMAMIRPLNQHHNHHNHHNHHHHNNHHHPNPPSPPSPFPSPLLISSPPTKGSSYVQRWSNPSIFYGKRPGTSSIENNYGQFFSTLSIIAVSGVGDVPPWHRLWIMGLGKVGVVVVGQIRHNHHRYHHHHHRPHHPSPHPESQLPTKPNGLGSLMKSLEVSGGGGKGRRGKNNGWDGVVTIVYVSPMTRFNQ